MTRTSALLCLGAALFCACTDVSRPPPAVGANPRIVTLAPNLTELVYAVGAGDSLVGVSAWSNYPPAARALPLIGDAFTIDQEQLALLDPDLLLVWESGTPAHTVEELRKRGFNVAVIRTRGLSDVAAAMRRIGALTGRQQAAADAADRFLADLDSLRAAHKDAEQIDVFYQVSARPLYTINSEHYVSELIDLCGGNNVFSDLADLSSAITVEAVVARNPEVMLASTDAGDDGFDEWRRWPKMAANLYGNKFLLPADELARATPRLISAGGEVCFALQQARDNRAAFRDAGQVASTSADDPRALPDRNRAARAPGR